MADNTTETATAAPGRNRKKMIVALVLVAALAFVAYSKLLKAPAAAEEPTTGTTEVAEGEIAEVAVLTSNVSGDELHYARVGVSVVLAEGVAADAVAPKFALLKDATIGEIQRSTPEQLRTVKGADDLRRRIGARAQKIWPDGEVVRIVFTEFLLQ